MRKGAGAEAEQPDGRLGMVGAGPRGDLVPQSLLCRSCPGSGTTERCGATYLAHNGSSVTISSWDARTGGSSWVGNCSGLTHHSVWHIIDALSVLVKGINAAPLPRAGS